MKQTAYAWLPACAIATALLLAGCGDDDDDDTDDTAGGGAASIEATATDFSFTPAAWTVPAGDEITIEFRNDGRAPHEWVIIERGEDIATEEDFAEDKVLFEVEAIDPGETVDETFTVDEPGVYQVICALPGHFAAGMQAELTVE